MNDLDKLTVMVHQMLMHVETDYSNRIENAQQLCAQMPTPENLQFYRDMLIEERTFKAISKRLISILDFYGRQGV